MLIGFLVELAVALLCIALGLLIWIKRMISLVNEGQCRNVQAADIPAYTRLLGLGLIFIGIGVGITGVCNLFRSPEWWIPLTAGLVIGFIFIILAQRKYSR
ncbi:MAG: hypothetical protein IKG93_07945 [Clostridiales bacterium]|nr:hypothetical protein [Clostridiales bacterium]